MGFTAIRGIFGRAGRRPPGITPRRWLSASSLELARVPAVIGMAVPAGRPDPGVFTDIHRRNIALAFWLAEAFPRRGACGSGSACGFFVLGARRKLDGEGWAFLPIMPGLAEELVFRGVYQSLLNRVFGTPWRWANAEFGWGLIITAIFFVGFNGLVFVDSQLHARMVLPAAIAPFLSSLVSGWVRERTNSVWLCVFGHNLSNIVIAFGSLFA